MVASSRNPCAALMVFAIASLLFVLGVGLLAPVSVRRWEERWTRAEHFNWE